MTAVNWTLFQKVCKDIFGYSPVTGIDELNIPLSDPAAFVGSMDVENLPLEAIRSRGKHPALKHVSFTFMLVGPIDVALDLAIDTTLKVFVKDDKFIIVTGTMYDWYHTIVECCSEEKSFAIRKIANECHRRFVHTRLNQVWSHLERHELNDGTFSWKK